MDTRGANGSAGTGPAPARPETDGDGWLEGWSRLVHTIGADVAADKLFEHVCRDVVEGFGFSRALIASVDDKNRRLVARAGYDPNMPTQVYMALLRLFRVPLAPERDGRRLVAAWCVENQQQAHVPDATIDSFRPEEATQRPFIIKALGTTEYVVTPIIYRGKSIAVLGVDKKGQTESITQREQALLRDVARLLALRLGPVVEAEAEASAKRLTAGATAPTGFESTGIIRPLLDGLEEALLVIGRDQRIRYANGAAASLLGFDPWEIAGCMLKDVMRLPNPEPFFRLLDAASEKGHSLRKRERLIRPGGADLEVQIRVLPLEPKTDARAVLLLPGGDGAEDRRLRDEVFHSVVHDLVAPLQSIVGFAELLAMGRAGELEPEQAEFVSRIVTGGEELIELVDRLLAVRALETGGHEVRTEAVQAATLIDRVFERLDGKALRAHIRLERQIDGELPPLRGDAAHLTAVFQNLVDNAIDATGAGGTIRVRGTIHGDPRFARFAVAQEFGGDPQERPDAFAEDFGRKGANPRRRSHGLGLAIVRRVVEAHGGELWAEGELEADLSITFTLPLDSVTEETMNAKTRIVR